MILRSAVDVKVSWAENSHTLRAEGVDALGTEKSTVAPQRGALLQAESGADPARRWGREADQQVPMEGRGGREEEEQKEGICWMAL